MKTEKSQISVSRYVAEDESFWQKHLLEFKASELTRKQYCRQKSVDYYRFTYWMKKLIIQQPQALSGREEVLEKPQLLPIQLKPEYKASEAVVPFSLSFKNGCVLQIHNEQALSIILEKMV
jgi:hypothetical protein